jgi:hypothetical protein
LKQEGRLVFFDILPATQTRRRALFPRTEKIRTPEVYQNLLNASGFEVDQMIDVTADTFKGFLKYTTRYFELRHLSAEIPEAILHESKAYLLMEKKPAGRCLLVSAIKPIWEKGR